MARETVRQNADALFVSAITAFELAVKCRQGKLELPLAAGPWFAEALDFHGLKEIPVSGDIAAAAVELPLLHNDPCDRIIIATAGKNDLDILTCDEHIMRYKNVRVIW